MSTIRVLFLGNQETAASLLKGLQGGENCYVEFDFVFGTNESDPIPLANEVKPDLVLLEEHSSSRGVEWANLLSQSGFKTLGLTRTPDLFLTKGTNLNWIEDSVENRGALKSIICLITNGRKDLERPPTSAENRRADASASEDFGPSSEHRMALVLKATQDAIWDCDLRTNEVWWNSKYQELFGVRTIEPNTEIWTWFQKIHPEDLPVVRTSFESALNSDLELWNAKYRFRHIDGSYRHVHDRICIQRAEDGTPIRIVGAIHDVTDLVRTEELFKTIFDQAAVGVALIDWKTAKYVKVNQRFCEILGYTPNELLEKTWQSVTHPDDLARDIYQVRLLERKDILECKFTKRYVRKDGDPIWVHISVTPVWLDDDLPESEIIVVEDITHRKEAEAKLSAMVSELAHLNRVSTMGEMATSIAHEVNQPLAAIANYAGTCSQLTRVGAIDNDEISRVLNQINNQARRAGEIVNRIKRFAADSKTNFESLDLNQIAKRVVRFMEHQIEQNGVMIQFNLATDLKTVIGDEVQLQQVLINMLQNSIDSMLGNAPANRQILIETLNEPGCVKVRVTDFGTGLAPDVIPKLFDSYFTTKENGLGLGLKISQRIVHAHGGKLVGNSNPSGVGCSFEFTVPLSGKIPARDKGSEFQGMRFWNQEFAS